MLYLLGAWFTAPSATTTLSDAGTYSSAMFDSMMILVPLILGFAIGGYIVAAVIRSIKKGVRPVLGGGGRRGGRRRR